MMRVNVYDFDGTIYDGDSTIDFWKHCIKKYPMVLCALPSALVFGILNQLKLCERSVFKEKFYAFLKFVPDVEKEVSCFWDTHLNRIKDFYYKRHRADDLIISASPDFLIGEACSRLGISCIASNVDPDTGRLLGPNCRGAEKLRLFREKFPQAFIDEFYSDSFSDSCLAEIARCAFFVKKNNVRKWSL